MEYDDIFNKLQFSKEWLKLGIITHELLLKLEKDYEASDDKYPEHYRWRAFKGFIEANTVLPPEIIKALYQLGNSDPDKTMGGSMMKAVIERQDCPLELLKTASESEESFLSKVANKVISRRNGS
jgi:hypothetical protein